jgi:hypothetical protein
MSRVIKKTIRQPDIALSGLTKGNDIGLKFTLTTPTPLSVARLVVKERFGDSEPDIDALINKIVTASPSADGMILDPGTVNGIAVVMFILLKSETNDFTANQKYVWDVEVFDVSNNSNTPRGGTVQFNPRVRTAIG